AHTKPHLKTKKLWHSVNILSFNPNKFTHTLNGIDTHPSFHRAKQTEAKIQKSSLLTGIFL
ncbi:MAG: hypothetical protein ABF479_20870, partial [Gluconacetobacter sp.]